MFSSPGLRSALSITRGAVTTSHHTGSSFLPFPSEHFRQTDLPFFLLSEIEKCSLAVLPFENIKSLKGFHIFKGQKQLEWERRVQKADWSFFLSAIMKTCIRHILRARVCGRWEEGGRGKESEEPERAAHSEVRQLPLSPGFYFIFPFLTYNLYRFSPKPRLGYK